VEDQAAVADITREMLVRAGYQVLVAGDPMRALEISAGYQGPIQLLLTDVVMPRMNGERLQQAIRAQRPDIAVLYMSGYTDDALACHGVLRPGVHLLEKPFTRERLLEKVREVLESGAGVVA
jgi:two-component system cell cycle sensor histidine kinase/response regulator CckA